MTDLRPNEGDRPSRLVLDRYATGELDGAERARVEAWLDEHPEGRAHLEHLEAARARVRPFDPAALRRSALQVEHEVRAIPEPANRPFPMRILLGVALAAAVLLVLLPLLRPAPVVDDVESHDVRFRGGGALVLFRVEGPALVPWAGGALGEGDTLAFRVKPAGHRGVVLASVDGTGAVTVFYPREGDPAEPFAPGVADEALPLTVRLDGAPGPEVWVAAFDGDPATVEAALRSAWQSGGAPAVVEWARAHDADAVTVEKR